ncbi:MAG: hypothetical protein AAF696_06070, partial [Bacteroidota bacterium]
MKALSYSLLLISFSFTSCHRSISRIALEENLQAVVEDEIFAGFALGLFDKDSIYYSNAYGW